MTTRDETLAQLTKELDAKMAALASLEARLAQASAKSESATPGGLTSYDSAVLSGIRRKPNRKADQRRWDAYTRESNLALAVDEARESIAGIERYIERVRALPDPPTIEQIKAASIVRDEFGWHSVVRVNAKSVTVATGFSWTDRIALPAILDAR